MACRPDCFHKHLHFHRSRLHKWVVHKRIFTFIFVFLLIKNLVWMKKLKFSKTQKIEQTSAKTSKCRAVGETHRDKAIWKSLSTHMEIVSEKNQTKKFPKFPKKKTSLLCWNPAAEREMGGLKTAPEQASVCEEKTPTDNFLNGCLRFSFSLPIIR